MLKRCNFVVVPGKEKAIVFIKASKKMKNKTVILFVAYRENKLI